MAKEDQTKKDQIDNLKKTLRDMVHDAGNPLQIISGRAQILRAYVEDEDLIKGLCIIEEQCKIARGVLDNMLETFSEQDPEQD